MKHFWTFGGRIIAIVFVGALAASFAFFASANSARTRQERPGVSQGSSEPNYTITRHGNLVFEADVAIHDGPSGPRVMLKDKVEIAGVKSAEEWIDFVHSFADTTSRALMSELPASASGKKGKVGVAFTLHRDGSIEGSVSVFKYSNDSSIDDAARLAIAKAAPYHGIPQNLASDAVQMRVTFAYNHPRATAAGDSQQ